MFRLSKISILQLQVTEYFTYLEAANSINLPVIEVSTVHRDSNPSTIVKLPEKQVILKLIKPMKWVDRFKFFWFRSRLSKEIRGNAILKKIGIPVPIIYAQCYAVNPFRKYLGYLLMQDLECLGYSIAQTVVEQKDPNDSVRIHIIENVVKDIRVMQQHRIVFTDLKLNNMFADSTGEITWIDTGINIYNFLTHKKFVTKNNHSIHRFLRIHNSLLSTQEINLVSNLLL